jgi:hypothetical protein
VNMIGPVCFLLIHWAKVAVSTLLRTSSIGNRKFLHAEHCRYGTRDLSLVVESRSMRIVAWNSVTRSGTAGVLRISRARFFHSRLLGESGLKLAGNMASASGTMSR